MVCCFYSTQWHFMADRSPGGFAKCLNSGVPSEIRTRVTAVKGRTKSRMEQSVTSACVLDVCCRQRRQRLGVWEISHLSDRYQA